MNNVDNINNFGEVNLEKCCPDSYMWSEEQHECVKVCDNCSTQAYGDIKHEFLNFSGVNGTHYISYVGCNRDVGKKYDYDNINRIYGKTEILDQYDIKYGTNKSIVDEDDWSQINDEMTYWDGINENELKRLSNSVRVLNSRNMYCSMTNNEINNSICPHMDNLYGWEQYCISNSLEVVNESHLCNIKPNNIDILDLCPNMGRNVCI
jgi:hypothetical protein